MTKNNRLIRKFLSNVKMSLRRDKSVSMQGMAAITTYTIAGQYNTTHFRFFF